MTVSDKIILAIDLGTTYCCSAVYQNGQVTVIPIIIDDDDDDDDDDYDDYDDDGYDDDDDDDDGCDYRKKDKTMPSYVTIFNDNEFIVGRKSKLQSYIYTDKTVYDSKRIIGKSFIELQLSNDIRFWTFNVINKNGKPYIRIANENEFKDYSPEQISSKLLEKIKRNAEKFLGQEITDAVITVPVHFNNYQRQATKDAAKLAGLNVIRLLNEPNAAIIAYGIDKKYKTEKIVLVLDIGGGTSDISILKVNNGIYKVLATAGDNHLGGIDFDNKLSIYLAKEFKINYKSEIKNDINKNMKAIRRLKEKSEQAKESLSEKDETTITIYSLHEEKDLEIKITRSQFEKLISNLLKRIIELIENALKDAKLRKDQIDKIIMVGGSTRIPIIQTMVKDFFNGKELNKSLNPDETVACGAAIFASTLSEENQSNNIVLYETLPLTLGIETKGFTMTPIIERNTHIPVRKTRIFTTDTDNQEAVKIKIYEGEHEISYKNNLLGEFILDNIPPAPHHQPQIEVTFEIDCNGILNVSATEKSTGYSNKITVVNTTNRLSKAEIEQQIQEANESREEEKKEKERINFMNNLKRYIENLHNEINNQSISLKIKTSDKEKLETKINSTKEWIDNNSKASKNKIMEQRDTLERMALPILNKS